METNTIPLVVVFFVVPRQLLPHHALALAHDLEKKRKENVPGNHG